MIKKQKRQIRGTRFTARALASGVVGLQTRGQKRSLGFEVWGLGIKLRQHGNGMIFCRLASGSGGIGHAPALLAATSSSGSQSSVQGLVVKSIVGSCSETVDSWGRPHLSTSGVVGGTTMNPCGGLAYVLKGQYPKL